MKIKAKYSVSQTRTDEVIDLEDLGFDIEEWNELDDLGKREVLIDFMENNPPYWVVDDFKEIEE